MRGGALLLAIVATSVSFGCDAADEPRPPNVVLVNVDDLGWRDVGCYGSPTHETPNIDALCAEGAVFTNAYAAASVCSPTRAAILTGRHPARSGVTDWIRPPLPVSRRMVTAPDGVERVDKDGQELLVPLGAQRLAPEETTLAEILAARGYATAHVGKWHLGGRGALPTDQGFEHNLGGSIHGHPPSYFDPYIRKGRPGIPGLPARKEGEHLTDREIDEAIRFMRENRDRPFFLNLWHHAVHPPIQPRPDLGATWRQRYRERGIGRNRDPGYAAMVAGVDEAIGRLVEALDELGLAESTLLLFTSDNGGWKGVTSNAPLRGGKGGPYEGGLRVPQIIRWKGRFAPREIDEPVTSVDLLPTIAEATGTAAADSTRIDGTSLMGLLEGRSESLDRTAIAFHYPHYWQGETPYSAIRRGRFKLIRRYEGPSHALYDLEADPGERDDLAEQMPERVQALEAELDAWLEQTGAILPVLRAQ